MIKTSRLLWHTYTSKCRNKQSCVCTYISYLSLLKRPGSSNTPITASTFSAQILISKYHSLTKGTRTPWRRGWFRDWVPKNTHIYKMSLEHLVLSERSEKVLQFSSVQFSCSVMSDSLQLHGLQHARPPCPSPSTGVYANSCPLSRWCHPTISSSVMPFSSHLQSFPASGSFPVSQFLASGGHSIGVSASTSVLPMNTQDWSAN